MGCEIIQINANTWRIEDDGVRLFLLAGTEKALLIDSGMNLNNARDIGMLVVYCLKDVRIFSAPHGLPEILAGTAVVLLQAWERNSLLSIPAGTLL